MFNAHQIQLIKQAVIGQIEALSDLRHEITIPPVSDRKHLNLASREIINILPNEIAEYERLRDFLDKSWTLDK